MIKYKGYSIYPDLTGVAPKEFQYYFALYQDEIVQGYGMTVEECEKQIDEIIKDKILDILCDNENGILSSYETVNKIFDLI